MDKTKSHSATRFDMNIADVQSVAVSAVDGENISETVEGLERYPRELRDLIRDQRRFDFSKGLGNFGG